MRCRNLYFMLFISCISSFHYNDSAETSLQKPTTMSEAFKISMLKIRLSESQSKFISCWKNVSDAFSVRVNRSRTRAG